MRFPLFFLLISAQINATGHNEDTTKKAPSSSYRPTVTRKHDILHTRLDVSFDWQRSQLHGKAAITGKTFFYPSSRLDLNAKGMEIETVEVFDLGKKNLPDLNPNSEIPKSKKLASSYRYQNDSLMINLGKEFRGDEKYLVRIKYTAKPDELKKGGSAAITEDKGLYFINPKGENKYTMPQIWTQGETQASSAWFPTIDSPNEKFTNDIYMTVDRKYTTLSNGKLITSEKNPDGTRTDHWKMDLPHSPYLVMMAVGEFRKVTDKPWNGKEVSYYVEKEYESFAMQIFGDTPEMMEFFSRILGTPYPWQKYSQIVVRDYVSGAMENTSATLHGDFMVYQNDREMADGKKGEAVIAHELFHQWFGNLVTAESWSNLPLNESFATYGEYLWEEFKNGRDAADDHSFSSRSGYFQEALNKKVELIRYHYDNREDMFDAHSYNKGGQILHMLRKYTGDEAFFAALKLYLQKNRFKSAEIHDLRLAFEETTGEDLNWFFDQWFLHKGHPELEIIKQYDSNSKTLILKISQTQDLNETPLYRLPVDIDIYTREKKERHKIVITEKEKEFRFSISEQPLLVNFDAERQLLAKKTYTKSEKELVYQYWNAPLFMDRYEALYLLEGKNSDPEVLNTFLHAAEKDKYWKIRASCFIDLKQLPPDKKETIKPLVKKIARNDPNNNVRATAIKFLSDSYKDEDLKSLFDSAVNDHSYAVAMAGLRAMENFSPEEAIQKAKDFENERAMPVFYAISGLYGRHGGDSNTDYFEKSRGYFSGPLLHTFLYQYERFLSRCRQPASFLKAAEIFVELANGNNMQIRSAARNSFRSAIIKGLGEKIENLRSDGKSTAMEIAALENVHERLQNEYKSLEAF